MTDERDCVMEDGTVILHNCTRCGNHHRVAVLPFSRPAGEMSHWALCPCKGEPILLGFKFRPVADPHFWSGDKGEEDEKVKEAPAEKKRPDPYSQGYENIVELVRNTSREVFHEEYSKAIFDSETREFTPSSERSHERWSFGEDKKLLAAFDRLISFLAVEHKRTSGAILSRLNQKVFRKMRGF